MSGSRGKRARIAATSTTSRPGLILTLTRRYPAATSASTLSRSVASSFCRPTETPASISPPRPPRRRHSGTPSRRAHSSQTAISRAAFAISCPRTRARAGSTSRGLPDLERERHRHEEVAQDVERGVVRLRQVEGVDVGHALGVADDPVGGDGDEQELLRRRAAEGGLEGEAEGQGDPADLDPRRSSGATSPSLGRRASTRTSGTAQDVVPVALDLEPDAGGDLLLEALDLAGSGTRRSRRTPRTRSGRGGRGSRRARSAPRPRRGARSRAPPPGRA